MLRLMLAIPGLKNEARKRHPSRMARSMAQEKQPFTHSKDGKNQLIRANFRDESYDDIDFLPIIC